MLNLTGIKLKKVRTFDLMLIVLHVVLQFENVSDSIKYAMQCFWVLFGFGVLSV